MSKTLPKYNMDNSETGCCPGFEPAGWDTVPLTSMKRSLTRCRLPSWLVPLALGLLLAGPVRADHIAQIVNQVSTTSYATYLNDLLYTHLGDNRGLTGPEHDLARDNIVSTFQNDFGLTTSLEPFTYSTQTYYNVVAVQPGTVRADEIYIIGAHYDSVNNPGADDNASGVAGVLEAARVLSNYNFEATIVYIAFDREEQGLYGSKAYASAHQLDDIRAMISLDMIAYNKPGQLDQAKLYGRSSSEPLKIDLAEALQEYGNITATVQGAWDASDHAPFEWKGFQACLLIEAATNTNPHYHRPEDSVDTPNYIDYEYAANMTRGVVAYLASQTVAVPEPSMLALLVTGASCAVLIALRRRSGTAMQP